MMASNDRQNQAGRRKRNLRWRPVDIAVASVIGVVSGFIFIAANFIPAGGLDVLIPGLKGLIDGFWLFAGPLALLIVRKPGAGVYAEVIAALIEMVFGAGSKVLLYCFVQGLGSEIAFLIFAYAVWNIWTTMLSGALAGAAHWVILFFTHLQAMSTYGAYSIIHLITTVISGAVISGALVWWLFRAIAKTGALERFESGRAVQMESAAAQDSH